MENNNLENNPIIEDSKNNKTIESNQSSVNMENKNSSSKNRKSGSFKSYVAVILVSSIVSSAGTGLYFTNKINSKIDLLNNSSSAKVETISTKNENNSTTSTGEQKSSSVNAIAKKVGPSVVGIRMTVGNPQSSYYRNSKAQSAEGSGVVISKDGYIMTNYHVVQYADPKGSYSGNTTLEVFLPDKRQAKAKFIGGDSKNDLAVIKVDLTDLTPAELGDSSKLEVGDLAVAIGNPLGMEFAGSVTTGVVSALNRSVETEGKTLSLIQTDAAINPGNSGGPLVNSEGKVIGINTIKISISGVEGLGFAIPINDAKPIIDSLIKYGYVKGRPLLGITGQDVTSVIAQQYGLKEGIYVTSVTQGSGADSAGIQKGDVIIGIGGKSVKTMKELDEAKKNCKAGDTVNVVVVRNNSEKTFKVTFSEDK